MGRISKIAVIGGGLAGLSAAGLLARKGLRVVVLEARDKTGGICGNTVRSGYTFNDGAIYLAFPAMLDRVFEKLCRDRSRLVPLRRISALQNTLLPDGTVVTIREKSGISIEGRSSRQRSADARTGVDRLLARWEPAFRLFANDILVNPFSAPRLILKAWRHLHKFRGTVASELTALFPDAAVRSALSGALLYTGLPPQESPAPAMLGLVALLSDGFYIPEGGMGKIPEAVAQIVLDEGGEILTGTQVNRILLKNGRAAGISTDTGVSVEADAVISTIHGASTYLSLLQEGDASPITRRRAERARLSHRAFVVQLGLSNRQENTSHVHNVLPWMEEQAEIFRGNGMSAKWLNYTVPTTTMPELAPKGGSIIEAYASIPQDLPVDGWDEHACRRYAEPTVEALARHHPLQIETTRLLSPKSFRDDLHLYDGAAYGLSPAAGPAALFPHRTPIAGLYQAGQTTYPGFGVASSAISGILAAELLARRELN